MRLGIVVSAIMFYSSLKVFKLSNSYFNMGRQSAKQNVSGFYSDRMRREAECLVGVSLYMAFGKLLLQAF